MKIPNSQLRIRNDITYEEFLAGALLVLPSVDSYDRHNLPVELNIVYKNFDRTRINNYVENIEDGTVVGIDVLKKGLTLDSVLSNGHTLREKLSTIAGKKVLKLFQEFNLERYLLNKQDYLTDKEKIKEKLGILLISEEESVYNSLKEYGFKNVDWFKSYIIADRYFKEHPEELRKYHFVITGNHSINVCTSFSETKLFYTLNRLCIRVKMSLGQINVDSTLSTDDSVKYRSFLPWYVPKELNDISCILNNIVEHFYSIGGLNLVSKLEEFKPIEYPIVEKLPLPAKKGDLKILYLSSFLNDEKTQRLMNVANSLGLDVTFKDDNNYALGKIKDKLGEYDIIIGSHIYSRNLLKIAGESTEQCKDTGRKLVLLATYEHSERGCFDFIAEPKGYKIVLNHIYAGELADDSSDICKREINVLGEKTFDELCLPAMLSAAIEAYNEKLPISITDLKPASEYDNEYQLALSKINEKENLVCNSMKIFEQIRNIVITYMNYRKFGLIEQNSNESRSSNNGNRFRIRRTSEGLISIENYYQNKINFAISFFDGYSLEDSKVLSIKMGDLPYEKVCIYTKKQEGKAFAPLASDTQLKVLEAFGKLVDETLSPLIPKEQPKANTAMQKKIGKCS